jgi:hypothetical protein
MSKKGVLTATPVNQKAHNKEVKDKVRAWAPVIGLRAAARKFQVKETTACWWAHIEHWTLPAVFAQTRVRDETKRAQISAHAAYDEVLSEQSRDTMLYMSSAALKASHQAAKMTGKQLLERDTAQALNAHNRTADTTHGWTALRQQNQVQVAVQVVMPTAEERAQIDREHEKLDEIAKLLKEKSLTP